MYSIQVKNQSNPITVYKQKLITGKLYDAPLTLSFSKRNTINIFALYTYASRRETIR